MPDHLSVIEKHPLIWRAGQRREGQSRLATLHPELDSALSGGLVSAGLVRLLCTPGIGELSLFKSVIAEYRLHKLCVFINPPGILQAPWLATANISAERVYQVAPGDNDGALWAAEQSLKSGACHCVLLWVNSITPKQARRLQVAASHNNALAILYMPPQCRRVSLPVSQDLSLSPCPGGLTINVNKQAQGWPVNDVFVALTHTPTNQSISAAMSQQDVAGAGITHVS